MIKTPARAGHRLVLAKNRQKSLTACLATLEGQSWANAYASLVSQLGQGPGAATTLKKLIGNKVALRTVLKKDEIYVEGPGNLALAETAFEYYVHPKTQVLQANPFLAAYKKAQAERAVQKKASLNARMRVIDENRQVHLVAGQWQLAELAALPLDGASVYDVLLKRRVSQKDERDLREMYAKKGAFALNSRALTFKESQQLAALLK